jgi:heat shock protein HtpX
MLVEKVHGLAKKAGLPVMPKVGIYDSPEVNAFATGPSKRRSLVAVSTGLLQHMDEQAIEGVLAHEIAHIANGDMVTMTLLQGIINTFVEFVSRVISFIISKFVRKELAHIVYLISYFVFSMVFSLLGILVVFAFSRKREYAADKGGAKLAGKEKMIHALRQLQSSLGWIDNSHAAVSTLKINNQQKHSLFSTLFSTHPSLEERIEYLQTLK